MRKLFRSRSVLVVDRRSSVKHRKITRVDWHISVINQVSVFHSDIYIYIYIYIYIDILSEVSRGREPDLQ